MADGPNPDKPSMQPREYKFVGTYCRKRRRRGPPNTTTADGQPSPPTTSASSSRSSIPASSFSRAKGPSIARRTAPSRTNRSLAVDPNVAQRPNASDSQEPLCEATVNVAPQTGRLVGNATVTNPPPPVDDVGQMPTISDDVGADVHRLVEAMGTSYDSFLNPFLYPSNQFLQPTDQLGFPNPQIPLFPESGTDQMNFGESSMDEGSSIADTQSHHHDGPDAEDDEDGNEVQRGTGDFPTDHYIEGMSLPSNISYAITQLLNRYDQEFCVMPLTHDFAANPFRFDAETKRGSQLLLHCILALSYKHINRDNGSCAYEAKAHKRQALRMLRQIESGDDPSPIEVSFLDAILVLMTLDCATSAHGPWVWYLKRAYSMIQATESSETQKTPRTQARIEMLVWWDVTLALTSRQGSVFSESTIANLLNPVKSADNPTFYSVSGCPEKLFAQMIRLGSFAREFELSATMTCVQFNMAPVLAVEQTIREWSDSQYDVSIAQYTPGGSIDTGLDADGKRLDFGDLMHYKEDIHHCAEAWRYVLLLYIERVFKWQRDQPTTPILHLLARRVLNHTSSCRRTSMVQKQLLLPVFLAGCETNDEDLREEARLYCSWWGEKTRYDMFLTAIGLLEEVWANPDPLAWWGSVMDRKSAAKANGTSPRQYLFG